MPCGHFHARRQALRQRSSQLKPAARTAASASRRQRSASTGYPAVGASPAPRAYQLSLVAGVAAFEAITALARLAPPARLRLKWPNDLLIGPAKVGGILANSTYPADFLRENLAIQNHVIDACHRTGVAKLVFLGSSCIYPKHAPQPITESALLTGPLEPTNEAYAIAKIAGIKACGAYNRQHGSNFLSLMPTNLYGPGDNYDLANSHVMPALIRRAHEARLRGDAELVVWGTGTPRRELMHSDDLASACAFALERLNASDIGECINVGTGIDLTIRELAETVCAVVGFTGRLVFDTTKPDGTPRKVLDVSAMQRLGWTAQIPLDRGIRDAYDDFLTRYAVRDGSPPP